MTVYAEGFARPSYMMFVSEEGSVIMRRQFFFDDLVKHKFRLTITEQGIEYSP